jgi:hypothetical protein
MKKFAAEIDPTGVAHVDNAWGEYYEDVIGFGTGGGWVYGGIRLEYRKRE